MPSSLSPEVAALAFRTGSGRLGHTFLPGKELNGQEKNRGLFIADSLAAIACLATGGVLLWVFVSAHASTPVAPGGATVQITDFYRR
ncbi:hypothetical protein [Streptomyces sp. ISL-94]|uniref:hypothetical protein n=1 Tax=Streptomyces sp. ISL-94 TaxID=2819190 RepID=UPI001BE6B3A7|nr:hypothetical protein [Streptomyces sp. ISL-94]MBT2480485.1 hypothetical protein [Streptomyces sp. ISL-94]